MEYPTEVELHDITYWPIKDTAKDCAALLAYVEDLWAYPEYFDHGNTKGQYLVSTGGWSGNEDLIQALEDNKLFWALCWVSSRRGGHYEFRLPEETNE